jgi:hypothetical protein
VSPASSADGRPGAGKDETPAVTASGSQKRPQLDQRLAGIRIVKRVPTRHDLAGDVRAALAPDAEHVEAARDRPVGAPQHEQRTVDASVDVGRIMLEVDRCAGAVVLAHRMNRAGNAERTQVLVA